MKTSLLQSRDAPKPYQCRCALLLMLFVVLQIAGCAVSVLVYSHMYPCDCDCKPEVPSVTPADRAFNGTELKGLICRGAFYNVRFNSNVSWCMQVRADEYAAGAEIEAEDAFGLGQMAIDRFGDQFGPYDFYGFIKKGRRYQLEYTGGGSIHLLEVSPATETTETTGTEDDAEQAEAAGASSSPAVDPLLVADSVLLVNASWINASQYNHSDGGGSNVFGEAGIIRFDSVESSNVTLPYVYDPVLMATVLERYGARLIPHSTPLPVSDTDLSYISYVTTQSFLDEWAFADQGPGLFFEHHNFPHYFAAARENAYPIHNPLHGVGEGAIHSNVNPWGWTGSNTRHAPIVIGRRVSERQFEFTGFDLPHGYSIYVPPGVIHGDWTFVGKIAISLPHYHRHDHFTDFGVDTVFVRNATEGKLCFEFESVRDQSAIATGYGLRHPDVQIESENWDPDVAERLGQTR